MKQEENSEQQFGVGQEMPAVFANGANGHSTEVVPRPIPELPRIFADNNDKKRMIFHWAIFVAIIILAMGLGAVVPSALEHRQSNYNNCGNVVGFSPSNVVACTPFNTNSQLTAGTVLTGLRDFNQFMLGRVVFMLNQPAPADFNYNGSVKVSFYSVKKNQDGTYSKGMSYKTDMPVNLTVNMKVSDIIYQSQGSKVVVALDQSFVYLREISQENYMFTITFPSNSGLASVQDVKLYGTVIAFGYTQFGVAIRFIFFFLTLGSTIYYFLRLRKIKRSQHVIEQRLVLALSFITVIFNDPFYVITATHPNYASNTFSVMFVVTLATYLVVFWLVILDRINNENAQVESLAFTWKKGLYLALLWLSCFFYYLFYTFAYFQQSPLTTTATFNKGGMVYLMMWIIVLFVAGFGYMIAMYVQIFLKFEEKLWRHQLFVFFSLFFVLVTFFFFFINGFDIHNFVGGRVLMLYVQLNTYLFYMQYMYSPTSEAIQKSQQAQGFQQAAAQSQEINTNIDELRSVEINFPDDNYNQMHEDGGSQDLEFAQKKKEKTEPVHHINEEMIEFE